MARRMTSCRSRTTGAPRAALKAVGADVRYTELPEANHNAWDPAYAMPELWTWLFAQHR